MLSQLQQDISHTWKSIMIVGPWLDAYFVEKVIDSLNPPDIEVRFLVRIDGEGVVDSKTLSALNLARENIKNFQARSLLKLHSKAILLDSDVFYLGSANWYWYSLHESLELTVTGKTCILPRLIEELVVYWDQATPLSTREMKEYHDLEPIRTEIHPPNTHSTGD
ncbi:phospholipase D-like domain-containing protein [Methanobacterium sp.]|uniref:phospholipase D-like domain-containing protein n=1 Tax=Methanobacterium sp. TaxID=2164 RepID=UPI00258999B5|nr:phospholipase D-like domain-containing protein [Methanobacterium sp.]